MAAARESLLAAARPRRHCSAVGQQLVYDSSDRTECQWLSRMVGERRFARRRHAWRPGCPADAARWVRLDRPAGGAARDRPGCPGSLGLRSSGPSGNRVSTKAGGLQQRGEPVVRTPPRDHYLGDARRGGECDGERGQTEPGRRRDATAIPRVTSTTVTVASVAAATER